ncbi:hypothetical protein HPB47_024344, partial [Ixodes persulcatus]
NPRTKARKLAWRREHERYIVPIRYILEVVGYFMYIWHHFWSTLSVWRLWPRPLLYFGLLEQRLSNRRNDRAGETGRLQSGYLIIKASVHRVWARLPEGGP